MIQREFCHLKITDVSYDELTAVIDAKIKERKFFSVTRLSFKTFVLSMFNKKLKAALDRFDVVLPASVLLHKLIKKTYPDYRFTMENSKDLMTPMMREYAPFVINFVLLGGSPDGLNRLVINLKSSFPDIKIIGTYPKYFLETKPEDVKTIIRKSEPHLFYVGLGENLEEIWLQENRDVIPKTVAICVKKQIDIMCNEEKDIPYDYKMKNREFLYTLKSKPWRIADAFVWLFVFIKWKLFMRERKKQGGKG